MAENVKRERTDEEIKGEERIANGYRKRDGENSIAPPIADVLDAIKEDRAGKIADSLGMNDEERRKEVLAVLAIRLEQLKHYHKHYYSLFKWMLTISLILLLFPFFKEMLGMQRDETIVSLFYYVLPILSILVSEFALVVLKIESTNVMRQLLGVRTLLSALNERYDDFPKKYFTKQIPFVYFVEYEPANIIIYIFGFVFLGGIGEVLWLWHEGLVGNVSLVMLALIVIANIVVIICLKIKRGNDAD